MQQAVGAHWGPPLLDSSGVRGTLEMSPPQGLISPIYPFIQQTLISHLGARLQGSLGKNSDKFLLPWSLHPSEQRYRQQIRMSEGERHRKETGAG